MAILDFVAGLVGTTAADLQLFLAYYAWFLVPVVAALAVVVVTMLKVLPRQRRREDLSGQDRRPR